VFHAPIEPLGPSSRRTVWLHGNHVSSAATRGRQNLEFIELFNSAAYFEDLSGFRISGDRRLHLPAGTILPGGGFLVIAKSPADLQSVYGVLNVIGPYTNSLSNNRAPSDCETGPTRSCCRSPSTASRPGRSRRTAWGIRWCWHGLPTGKALRRPGARATSSAGRRRHGWLRV